MTDTTEAPAVDMEAVHARLGGMYDDAIAAINKLRGAPGNNFFFLLVGTGEADESPESMGVHVFSNAKPSVSIPLVNEALEEMAHQAIIERAKEGDPMAAIVLAMQGDISFLEAAEDAGEQDLPGHVDVGVDER